MTAVLVSKKRPKKCPILVSIIFALREITSDLHENCFYCLSENLTNKHSVFSMTEESTTTLITTRENMTIIITTIMVMVMVMVVVARKLLIMIKRMRRPRMWLNSMIMLMTMELDRIANINIYILVMINMITSKISKEDN